MREELAMVVMDDSSCDYICEDRIVVWSKNERRYIQAKKLVEDNTIASKREDISNQSAM